MNTDNLQKLLQRELTRKEFLQVIGLTILSMIGIRGLLANVDKSLGTVASGKSEKVYSEDSYGS